MAHITLHRRFHALTLLAAGLCIVGSGVLPAQNAPPTAGIDLYIQFLEERSMQAQQQAERISGEGVRWRNDNGRTVMVPRQ